MTIKDGLSEDDHALVGGAVILDDIQTEEFIGTAKDDGGGAGAADDSADAGAAEKKKTPEADDTGDSTGDDDPDDDVTAGGDEAGADDDADAGGGDDAEAVADPAKKKPNRVQERIDELTAARHAAERRADVAEALLAERRPAAAAAAPEPPAPKPKLEDFDTHEAWTEAMIQHGIDAGLKTIRAEAATTRTTSTAEASAHAAEVAAHDRWRNIAIPEARKRIKDFDAVALAPMPLPAHVFVEFRDDPKGPELLYYLGKNRAELARLNALTTGRDLTREVTLLLAKMGAVAPRTTTRTPPPPPRVQGGGPKGRTTVFNAKDQDAYRRAREGDKSARK